MARSRRKEKRRPIRLSRIIRGASVVFVGLIVGVLTESLSSSFRAEGEEFFSNSVRAAAARFRKELELVGIHPVRGDSAARERLRPLFAYPLVDRTGYPFIILPNGAVRYHFFRGEFDLPVDVLEQMALSSGRSGQVEVHLPGTDGMRRVYYSYSWEYECYFAVEIDLPVLLSSVERVSRFSWTFVLVSMLLVWLVMRVLERRIYRFVDRLHNRMHRMAIGEPTTILKPGNYVETNLLSEDFNALRRRFERVGQFAHALHQGETEIEFEPAGPRDRLGTSLLGMRDTMRRNAQEVQARRAEEEIRSWTNRGIADFSRLLREHSSDIVELTEAVIERLVVYLSAAQGAFFVVTEREGKPPFLRLAAAFAYDRKKYLKAELELGEGLVGTCAIEREIVHMDDIPPEYSLISSGIGGVPPRELLLVPLKTDDALYGVIELATLAQFTEHMVQFAQVLSVSIAQTLQLVQNADHMRSLLARQDEQRAMMSTKEEELRQSMEELRATQEQISASRREDETLRAAFDAAILFAELSPSGAMLRFNEGFAELVSHLDYVGVEELNLLSLLEVVDHPHGEGESFEEAVWPRIQMGTTLRCLLRIQGASQEVKPRLLQASLMRVEGQGEREDSIYLMAQDVSWLLDLCDGAEPKLQEGGQ